MFRPRSFAAVGVVALLVIAFMVARPALTPALSRADVSAAPPSTAVSTATRPAPSPTATKTPIPPTATATPTRTPGPTKTPRTTPMQSGRASGAEYPELLSNSLFLDSPTVLNFRVQAFLDAQPGPLKAYRERVTSSTWSAADIIAYNAINFGINPQFILVALEAHGALLSNPGAVIPTHKGTVGFNGYVRWLSHQAGLAYDGARYKELDYHAVFEDMSKVELPNTLNAGTTAIEVVLAKTLSPDRWRAWVQGSDPLFSRTFRQYFGNPYAVPDEPVVAGPVTDGFSLPFPAGETWFFTSGPHSYDGDGARPWSSLDFAPPEKIWCPGGPMPEHRWVVATADGVVIQSGTALVVIDHGDGWRTYYSHVATQDRVAAWKSVRRGEAIGHPSCETEPGGFSNGIHVHMALWRAGLGFVDVSGFNFSGWDVVETGNYNGRMTMNDVTKTAESSRVPGWNDILNPEP